MSSDDRDDVTEEEVEEEPEAEVEEEPTEEEEIVLEEMEVPEAGGGCSAGIWVVILLILAALVAVGWYHVKKSAQEARAQVAADAQQVRDRNLRNIARGVTDAELALQRGDIGDVLKSLQGMHEKLGYVANAANQAGYPEATKDVLDLQKSVRQAMEDIEAQYQELAQVAESSVGAVRSIFHEYAPSPPPPPAKPAQAETAPGEAAEAKPAEPGEERPAEETAEQPPEQEPPKQQAPEEEPPEQEPPSGEELMEMEVEQGEAELIPPEAAQE